MCEFPDWDNLSDELKAELNRMYEAVPLTEADIDKMYEYYKGEEDGQ